MDTKVKARFANGEVCTMIIRGGAEIGDRVRTFGSQAIAIVIAVERNQCRICTCSHVTGCECHLKGIA